MRFILNQNQKANQEASRKLYLSAVRRRWRGLKRFSKSIIIKNVY